MKLYHATKEFFEIDSVIGPFSKTKFMQNKVEPKGLKYREDLLEQGRPKDRQSRMNAVFSFSCPIMCKIFMEGEGHQQFYIYEIKADQTIGAPMAIVDKVDQHLSDDIIKALVSEYWHPIKTWNFFEIMSQTVEVIGQIDVGAINILQSTPATMKYSSDINSAQKLTQL